jgi:hypothetical protein
VCVRAAYVLAQSNQEMAMHSVPHFAKEEEVSDFLCGLICFVGGGALGYLIGRLEDARSNRDYDYRE